MTHRYDVRHNKNGRNHCQKSIYWNWFFGRKITFIFNSDFIQCLVNVKSSHTRWKKCEKRHKNGLLHSKPSNVPNWQVLTCHTLKTDDIKAYKSTYVSYLDILWFFRTFIFHHCIPPKEMYQKHSITEIVQDFAWYFLAFCADIYSIAPT